MLHPVIMVTIQSAMESMNVTLDRREPIVIDTLLCMRQLGIPVRLPTF